MMKISDNRNVYMPFCFESFSFMLACPEPVLVNDRFHQGESGAKSCVFVREGHDGGAASLD
jgi:hypothetical protein